MIEKSRLQELISEGATIYWLCGDFVSTTRLNNLYYISECNILCKNNINGKECVVYLKDLYETRKQAEWSLKYHATRTEELNLPTWEEFKTMTASMCVAFVGEDWAVYELSNDYDSINEDKRIILTKDDVEEYAWQATEENYIKACDLCLKLFKGEENV